jgi:hypothetical protein
MSWEMQKRRSSQPASLLERFVRISVESDTLWLSSKINWCLYLRRISTGIAASFIDSHSLRVLCQSTNNIES